MTDDTPTHVIISMNAARDNHGRLRWHEPVFDEGTYRTLCSADKRMETAVLVRLEDIPSSDGGWFVPTDEMTECHDCARLVEERETA